VLLYASQQWSTAKALASLADPRSNVEHTEVMREALGTHASLGQFARS